jgi:hypothetical protein
MNTHLNRRASDALPKRSPPRQIDHIAPTMTEHALGWRDYNMGKPEPKFMSAEYAAGRKEARMHAIHELDSRADERIVLQSPAYELEPVIAGPAKPRRIAPKRTKESRRLFAGLLCAVGSLLARKVA